MKQVILLLVIPIFFTACSSKTEEVHLQQKKLTSAIYASGTLVPEKEYKVVSGVDGYLADVFVKEGDHVKKGQLLFAVNSEVRQAQEQGAQAIVQQTLPTVSDNAPTFRELRGQIEVAGIKKHQDSLLYARYKKLYEQEAISKTNYERYYLQYQSSLKDYQNLKQRLEQQELTATLQMQQAKNQLSLAQAQTNYGKLHSFMEGTIYDIYKKEGDLVSPNQQVALVGSGAMIGKLLVDEDDLGKIFTGQKVLITMDAYPDKVFTAKIIKIYPLLSKAEQSFRVDVSFDEQLPVEMYGLNLEANIVLAENREVWVLPRAAIQKGDSVLVKEKRKTKKVKIMKGMEDEDFVEIKSGISRETTVIIEQ